MTQQLETPSNSPFAVDPDSDVPVGVQLNWRVRTLIITGRLAAGESLPSVRRLAAWASVNVNTVRGVYESLEREGLIFSRQGQGTFVAEHTAARPELEAIALDALRRTQQAGSDPHDVAMVVMACADMLGSVGHEPLEPSASPQTAKIPELIESSETIEVRQELRRQIAHLEADLAAYVRDLPTDDAPTAPARAKAHIAGVEELEQTRDSLIAKLSRAQRAAEQRAREEGEARAGRAKLLEAREDGPAPPGAGPLGGAMSWWRAKP